MAVNAARAEPQQRLPWTGLFAVLGLAALLRALFYPGYFGSDEVTYTDSAFKLLQGDRSVSSYVGANRYGVNLPVAGIAALLGRNEFAAALYSVLCSMAEIALVVVIGTRMIGARAALLAGFVLASLPIHVHFAGRLMADAPLALAITASFLFFWDGQARGRSWSFLLAGLAAGWSFWIKPAVVFYVLVLMSFPLLFWRWNWRWAWVVTGFAIMVLANCLLFWALTGRPWYLFEVIAERRASGYLAEELAAGTQQDQAWYYLVYLFAKVYHTWLLGLLALFGGVLVWSRRHQVLPMRSFGLRFTVWWALGLLVVLSVFVVSIRPLTLVPKQTNYMLIFVAPLAMLAGCALATARGRLLLPALALWLVPAALLAALLQGSVTVFTANAKAVHDFARQRPGATVYATTNAYRLAAFERLVRPRQPVPDVRFVGDMAAEKTADKTTRKERYAVIDSETLSWGSGEPFKRVQDVPRCWVAQGTLAPRVEGLGPRLVGLGLAAGSSVLSAESPLAERARKLAAPSPAYVFSVPAGC